MIPFKTIRARAAGRKGGEAALAALFPEVPSPKRLAKLGDDRVLAEMTTDVVACLRDARLDISESPSSRKDLRRPRDVARRTH